MSGINDEWSQIAANGIIHQAHVHYLEMTCQSTRPHVLMRPRVFMDGNRWCALYGDDLATGIAGFGVSPDAACIDFDVQWFKPTEPTPAPEGRP